MQAHEDDISEDDFEDRLYENNLGLPDSSWIMGRDCSEIFLLLDTLERKIIVKYYLEGCGDGIIADSLGLSISHVHKKRTSAVKKLANALGKNETNIVRHRQCIKSKLI